MEENIIPYIGGEEEKSEKEPLRIWGEIKDGVIKPAHKVQHHQLHHALYCVKAL